MCGFAGFFGFNDQYSEKSDRLGLLEKMSGPISRRGPDDEKFYDDGTLSFVFRRLSIVDLKSGQQPIWNENETIFISINGEIYNHRELHASLKEKHQFRTHSDTEIVLHLYEEMGPRCLDLLIGMFAIVIYDKSKNELFLARDRVGIKPLYFSRLKDGFLFGSELKALLAFPECPREIDLKPFFLGDAHMGSLNGDKVSTYVKGVDFLPGGHYAILNQKNGYVEKPYWNIKDHFAQPGAKIYSSQHYVDEYARLFEDSVEKRLMSDVPVGSFLSGGIDSVLITAIAGRKNKDLHCFHALEKTTFLSGDTLAAKKLASQMEIPFHPVFFDSQKIMTEMKFSLSTFEYFIWMMDSPRFDIEWLFKHELHRYAKTKVPAIKVMLLGQGSDEFAGGYSNSNGLGENWKTYASAELKRDAMWRFFARDGIPYRFRNLLSEDHYLKSNSEEENYHQMAQGRIQFLQGYNLWHEDRTSSVQGVESRVPFLDHRLIEFLVSIPGQFHPELFWDKKIVRRAAERWVPNELANRPKIGFYHTRDKNSIWDLKRSLVERVFPEYRDKYLKTSKSLFSAKSLEEIFSVARVEDMSSWSAIDNLIACMSHDCFNQIIHSQNQSYLSMMTPPSPFTEARDGMAEKIWHIKDWNIQQPKSNESPRRWKDLDCPRLADGVEITFHLPNSLHFSGEGIENAAIDLTPETEWILTLVRLLKSPNYHPLNFNQLVKKLKLPLGHLKDAVRVLGKMKLLTVYREPDSRKKKAA